MSLEGKRIGFIGGGAMAEALAGGLIGAAVAPTRICVADVDASRRAHLEEKLGVAATPDNASVARESDVVVLAVKPGVVAPALEALDGLADPAGPLWISIAAGIPLARLEAALSNAARIVRAMPNTPALVQAGATAICGNERAAAADMAAARSLFDSVGLTWEAPSESLIDAVTGLSGSGPAYVFLFLEVLARAGERAGLPREAAELLAGQTVFGAAKLARESDRSPAQLRDQVSSPGGTTLAALERLDVEGFRRPIEEAVEAATRRSRELGA
jgi:pyrroline-5-carboxylate reductase